MKRVVILLVALNIMIFSYFQLPDLSLNTTRQSSPDLYPQKIKLLSDNELQALPTVSAGSDIPSVTKE
jgi:hypothetical protein